MKAARAAWLAVAIAASNPALPTAHAFCVTTVNEADSDRCPEPCDLAGQPLFWPRSEIVYTLNTRIFPGMDEATESRLFAQSFGAWEGVRCAGEPVGFRFVEDSETTSELGVHHETGVNKNVLALLSPGQWLAADHASAAFALTSVYFDPGTGEIRGADIEFNGTMPRFGECPSAGCPSPGTTDLRNVATHEIGHFLGLSHSDDALSTMACDAKPGDIDKRSLGLDDVAGLCAAYPPGESFLGPEAPVDPAPRSSSSGCGVHGSSPGAGAALWLLGVAACCAQRVRRRARR